MSDNNQKCPCYGAATGRSCSAGAFHPVPQITITKKLQFTVSFIFSLMNPVPSQGRTLLWSVQGVARRHARGEVWMHLPQ